MNCAIIFLKWVGITWSRLTGMKFCPVLSGSCQFQDSGIPDPGTLHKLYLMITCEKFHPGKMETFFSTAGIPLCLDKTFSCNHFSSPRRDENVSYTSVWKNPKKYISIDRRFFFCIFTTYMTSIYEKKNWQLSL